MSKAAAQTLFEPSFGKVFFFSLLLSALLFLRPPSTNFVFDEQEAILANPYLRGASGLEVWDAWEVDFWGLPPKRTIGSYRPLPNLLWRLLVPLRGTWSPFVFLLLNLVVHALTTALLSRILLFSVLFDRSRSRKSTALSVWACSLLFACAALSTEAISGAVGLADLLVGVSTAGSIWTLLAFGRLLVFGEGRAGSSSKGRTLFRTAAIGSALFGWALLGSFSKESMVGTLLFLPLFALTVCWHREIRGLRALAYAASVALPGILALGTYLLVRNQFFPARPADSETFVGNGPLASMIEPLFRLWAPPVLPDDAMNNPLFLASGSQRTATASRIFLELSCQVFVPFNLSADWSFPRLVPRNWDGGAFLGTVLVVALLGWFLAVALRFRQLSPEVRWGGVFGLGILCTYLPVSNLLVLLPTIRAERLFYTPTLFVVLMFGSGLGGAMRRFAKTGGPLGMQPTGWLTLFGIYLALQAVTARSHALDYQDDLSFWKATARGDPPSAKSLLNLGIMLGARGKLDARLAYTEQAVSLAPAWPMGQVYLADVHCRRGDLELAKGPYLKGLGLAPDSKALTALALQCIWEKGAYLGLREELHAIAQQHSGSWLEFFLSELDGSGEQDGGIKEQYRPRRYNGY